MWDSCCVHLNIWWIWKLFTFTEKQTAGQKRFNLKHFSDDIEVLPSNQIENVQTTPIVVNVETKKNAEPLAFVNQAADFEDGGEKTSTIERSKVTVFLKPKNDDVEMDVVTFPSRKSSVTSSEEEEVHDNPHVSFIWRNRRKIEEGRDLSLTVQTFI